jgi:hypothetical protein
VVAQAIGGPRPAAEAGQVAANPEVPAASEPRNRHAWITPRRAVFLSIALMTILVALGTGWALSGRAETPSPGVDSRAFTTSPIASRLYEEGLPAYYAGDWEMALCS